MEMNSLPLESQKKSSSFILVATISPKKTFLILVTTIFCLTTLSFLVQTHFYSSNNALARFSLIKFFNLDGEANVPTLYSSGTLFFCSILLTVIAYSKKIAESQYTNHWRALALIFTYLSLDEAISIHEVTIEPLRKMFHANGFLHFTWIVPGAIIAALIGISFLGFLLALPKRTRFLFITAGVIYISGALGMEAIDGYYSSLYGDNNLTYGFLTDIEECLEMVGIAIFIYSLLSYMISRVTEIKVQVNIRNKMDKEQFLLVSKDF